MTRRLSTRIITILIAVVLLTAVAVGVPAIYILRHQLDRQAWDQVEQGQRVAIALYAAHVRETQNLATLTAQRPTLKEMLYEGDQAAFTEYLHVLKDGAGLTRVIVCNVDDEIIVSTDESIPSDVCKKWKAGNYQYEPNQPKACLTAYQPIENETGQIGEVFVCNQLDWEFVEKIAVETGLEHTIWINDLPVATSFDVDLEWLENIHRSLVPMEGRQSHYMYSISDTRYYAARIPLEEDGLSAEVALDVSGILATQNQLGYWMVLAIIGVVLLVSLLGVLLSRQLSRPLVDLAGSAEALRRGHLDTPVETDVRVLEVAQVAQALEGARTDLLVTLTSLKSERDWSENLLASIVEGIVTLDREGRITFFSHGAERITGWPRSEVLGRSCDDVFRLVDSEQLFHQVIPPPGRRAKFDVLLAGGKDASLAVTRAELAPIEASGEEVALVFRDISEEEAIHRILGHFLANVAHEFRTPLSALAASIELLLDQTPDLSLPELHELLNSLHLGTLGLQTLVDNLLESASIESGHFRISPRGTDLGNIIAEATNTMQSLLEKYGQRLVVEMPVDLPKVQADPRRTVQVLVNLIANASRYGPPDAEIQIKVSKSQSEARISVVDQGPGISPEVRENLFRRFVYPLHDSTTTPGGAGLGLSVVKTIVEAHGGCVGVEDSSKGGSEFWFTIPVVEGG